MPRLLSCVSALVPRSLAALLKDLGKSRRSHMAFEIFDYLKSRDPVEEPELAALLDVYTYTTMIVSQTGAGCCLVPARNGFPKDMHLFCTLAFAIYWLLRQYCCCIVSDLLFIRSARKQVSRVLSYSERC